MEPAAVLRLGIAGPGRLGATLAVAAHEAGHAVRVVAGRDREATRALAGRVGAETAILDGPVAFPGCELVFLTVPDGAIAGLAAQVSWQPGQSAVHCSGALGREALHPAEAAGAATGVLHPLQSFPSRQPEPARFAGIWCGIDAGEPLRARLEALAAGLGAHPFHLDGADHARYHAAAVFASNYAVALMHAAREAWVLAGLPAELARPALAPLLGSVAANVAQQELEDALTGPVARGDAGTVAAHLAGLAANPGLRDLYRRLALELLDLTPHHGAETRRALLEALDATDGDLPLNAAGRRADTRGGQAAGASIGRES